MTDLCGEVAVGMWPCIRKPSKHTWHITPYETTPGHHIWMHSGGGYFAFGEPNPNLKAAIRRAKLMDRGMNAS